MGERKLNFNAPLLSVRRFASPSASEDRRNRKIIENPLPNRQLTLPFYRSEFDLEQVTEPVAVPFRWERIPGRAKDSSGPGPQPPEEASVTPRLPPARFINAIKTPLEKECYNADRLRCQVEPNSLNDKECSKEGINEKGDLDLEDDDDVYSDAQDTLSPTDSFSMNYSASGLSGSDGPDVKPSGTFSTDPQTRDFMLSRFLPAARAMALEPPQYSSRKQGAPLEQPRKVERVVSEDRRLLLYQNQSDIIPLSGQNKEEEQSEDEDNEFDDPGYNSAKGCGLFPRLCFKNSLSLLSPVPGMKLRTLTPVRSTRDVVRPGKMAQSHSQTSQKHAWNAVDKSKSDCGVQSVELHKVDKKHISESSRLTRSGELQTTGRLSPDTRSWGAGVSPYSQTAQKHAWNAVDKSKSDCGVQSAELHKVDKKHISESRRLTRSGELQTTGRLSPYTRSWGAGVSPYRNKAPQSPFRGSVSFLGMPKEVENVKANRFSQHTGGSNKNKQELGSMNPAVEKTLHVDTVNNAEKSCSNSSSSVTQGWIHPAGEYLDISPERRGLQETTIAESGYQDIQCLNIANEGSILDPLVSIDADKSYVSKISHPKGQEVTIEDSGLNEGFHRRSSLECSKLTTEGNLNISSDKIHKTDETGTADASFERPPAHPPLPKSPSESWLWRTLPSVSARYPILPSNLGTLVDLKREDPKTTSTNTKWETIVKSSHLHHDHVRYSQELILPSSQQPKT
ncbi:hypothetical protein I3843_09G070000 [Carya illinoinensis]|uniref:Uncharacterized protein n=2 Tax=Carya illinoinensis TaxID=32201 RepID=A0A8T1PBD1_CARIL|nr:uncharacterized protein LOC122276710 [Carya illinoinensis]KAG6641389.1 hypothetical protein CIPAW_09G070400 [Carya illinoinensis]KAG6694874.1 hypothetical protein I3842_09G069900 [Carya illinoinensis]KAG6694875.1 hypothetical protein I3842_09G069900 [Carya illinoinensis]KAG7962506.1 hypothetical protein I3843_09G070000 [Carya illinoinensis]KAG7962508.1 hypothetical protein I3843_09G070000 [Carya illinoinensis]